MDGYGNNYPQQHPASNYGAPAGQPYGQPMNLNAAPMGYQDPYAAQGITSDVAPVEFDPLHVDRSADQPPAAAAGGPAVDDERTDSDVDVPAPAPPPVIPKPAPAPKASTGRRGGRGGIITLSHLIDDGIIEPGEDVLTVEYKGNTHIANLLSDGRILCNIGGQAMTFDSPSAFSIFLKRLVNPSRKADDGWKTVKYKGRLLEHYKAELARKRLGLGEGGDSTAALEALAAMEPRAKRARTDGTKEPRFRFGTGNPAISSASVPDRPRRQRKAPPRFAAIGVDDEHALQPLEAYGPGEQPFTVHVHPAAEVMMDFHAHLCMNEVIGVLAGTWDPLQKRIDVLRAYPVRELTTEDDSINVEMDPEDQVAKNEEVLKSGLKVVGWYHSHPTFQAIPSTIDIYNQVLQQNMYQEGGGAAGSDGQSVPYAEPYVAAIVSPYDKSRDTPASDIQWFYVQHTPGALPAEGQRPDEVGCIGKALAVEPLWEPLGQLENLPVLQREMEQMSKRYAGLPDRANLEANWVDGSLRAEKMVNSILGRLRPLPIEDSKLSKFADKVLFSTRAVWNIYGKPVMLPTSGLAAAAAAAAAAAPSAAAPSGPASTAASGGEGGDTETAVGSVQQQQHDVDEPISDDDGEATEDET